MSVVKYSSLRANGTYNITIDGVTIGTLTDNHNGTWTAYLNGSKRTATKSSLPALKEWVNRLFD